MESRETAFGSLGSGCLRLRVAGASTARSIAWAGTMAFASIFASGLTASSGLAAGIFEPLPVPLMAGNDNQNTSWKRQNGVPVREL
jgi:hypothetical protein